MSSYREALETLSDLVCDLEFVQKELAQLKEKVSSDSADARWEAAYEIFKILNNPRGDKLHDVVTWVCAPKDAYFDDIVQTPQVFFNCPDGDVGSPSQGILNASHVVPVLDTLRNGWNAENPDLMAELVRLRAENEELKKELAATTAIVKADAKAIAAAIDFALWKGGKE